MNYNFAQPSEKFKPYIKQYWGVENVLKNGEQYTQRIIPSGLPELILYLGHKPTVDTKNRSLEDSFLLNGQQNDFYDILISDNLSVFSIQFKPQGVSQFFSIPYNELLNNSVPLKYLNKDLYAELESKLAKESSFQLKVNMVEECLFKLLINNKKDFEFRRINNAIESIRITKGNIDIDTLASNACLSRKQFERIFSEYIGISPKQYLKTIRLQATIHFKSKHKNVSMTELTYINGYYDQSHFINDFKTMTGLTPKQFFDECEMPMSDFFE
ncbi:MAG: helix-turn-helix domain-containing protein [Bacteroidales bacterium]|jgi:AraC-like DNA-binding protein|nr:helix-turn-helix domain-containing protein [Bacteroidales bacterium]